MCTALAGDWLECIGEIGILRPKGDQLSKNVKRRDMTR